MNYQKILKFQKYYGVTETQEQINSGTIWKFEGSVGRFAMRMLEIGVCMLPLKTSVDYYGNKIPARNKLKPGTKGTYLNCFNFWKKVYDGDIS